MERVTFLIEQSNERLACLLNPENLVIKRISGVRKRSLSESPMTCSGQSDTPLQFTGGGQTLYQFDLLFDLSVVGSTIETKNIRKLTAPLWDLSENKYNKTSSAYLPVVRFIWGKCWNVPGVITAVAERLEAFSPEGEPGRSWLRMKMVRISEEQTSEAEVELGDSGTGNTILSPESLMPFTSLQQSSSGSASSNEATDIFSERNDLSAYLKFGNQFRWREIIDGEINKTSQMETTYLETGY